MKFFIFQCSLAFLGTWVIHNKPSFELAATTLEFAPPLPIDTLEANKLFQEGIAQLEQNQLVKAKELLKKAETLGYQRLYELEYQLARLYAQKKQYCTSEIHLKKAIKSGFQDYELLTKDTMFAQFKKQDKHWFMEDELMEGKICGQFWQTYYQAFKKNKPALFKGLVARFPTQAIDSITINFLYNEDLNPSDYEEQGAFYSEKDENKYLKNKKSSSKTPSEELFLEMKDAFFKYDHFIRGDNGDERPDESIWAEYTFTISNNYIALIYSKQVWEYAWLPRTYYLETYSLDGKKIASRKIAWRQFYDCQTVQFDHQTGEIHATKHELKWKLGISANTRKVLTIKDIEQIKATEQSTYFIADNGDIGMKMK